MGVENWPITIQGVAAAAPRLPVSFQEGWSVNLSELDGQGSLARQAVKERAASVRRLPSHTISDLLIPTSYAIDLAEGRSLGHAQRVAYIAASIAGVLEVDNALRLACCYAGLLHDIGVIAAGSGLSQFVRGDERLVFASLPLLTPEAAALGASDIQGIVVDRLIDHTIQGARSAQELALPPDAIKGIASHHENWNGGGYPYGLDGRDIPIVGRVVALADQVESMISHATSLQARRNLPSWLKTLSGNVADPEVVQAFRVLSGRDTFWLGFFSSNLASELAALCALQRE